VSSNDDELEPVVQISPRRHGNRDHRDREQKKCELGQGGTRYCDLAADASEQIGSGHVRALSCVSTRPWQDSGAELTCLAARLAAEVARGVGLGTKRKLRSRQAFAEACDEEHEQTVHSVFARAKLEPRWAMSGMVSVGVVEIQGHKTAGCGCGCRLTKSGGETNVRRRLVLNQAITIEGLYPIPVPARRYCVV